MAGLRTVAMMVGGALLAASGCGDERTTLSGGEVVDSAAYNAIDYRLTSENYRRWVATQELLDSAQVTTPMRIDPRNVDDEQVDAVVDALEDDSIARPLIERADWDVRDYVLTTVALAQTWDAASSPATRLAGVPEENLALVRREAQAASPPPRRARAAFIRDPDDDSDADSDSDSDSDKRGKGKGKGKDRHRR